MPGKGARGAEMRRAAAVLLLAAVAAVGLRAGGAFSAAGSPEILGLSGQAVYWAIAGAEVVLALAGIALLIARLIWGRQSGKPRRKRRSLWWLLLLPFFTFGLAKALQKLRELRERSAAATAAANQAAPRTGSATHLPAGNPWPLLVFFIVMALAAAALMAYRRRRVPPPPLPDADPDAEPLAAALAAGARALHSDPDPSAAIIGCYAAMERSLADAGLPPRMADTPTEVLHRATAGGRLRPAAPATLTGLFRRARYSSHPMTEADRAAAIGALAQVQADLDSGTLAGADLGGGA